MREIIFDRDVEIPIIDAKIRGPRKSHKVRLVFDTGCGLTQINTDVIESIGYSAIQGENRIGISGASGEIQEGYSVKIASLTFFGLRVENALVGAMDFEHLQRQNIDGLLGFDLIKQLHIEMSGPQGVLTILSL